MDIAVRSEFIIFFLQKDSAVTYSNINFELETYAWFQVENVCRILNTLIDQKLYMSSISIFGLQI